MDYLDIFVKSYERAMTREVDGESFCERFYRNFLSASPTAAAKFAHTDMRRQREMLRKSMDQMTYFSLDRQATPELERLAERHGKGGADIGPDLYDDWLEALLDTVRAFDPHYDRAVDLAWRVTFAPGITYMKAMYARTESA